MRSKKRSAWFEGLLYAEEIGAREAYELVMRGEFYDIPNNEFRRGLLNYIEHYKKLLVSE